MCFDPFESDPALDHAELLIDDLEKSRVLDMSPTGHSPVILHPCLDSLQQ